MLDPKALEAVHDALNAHEQWHTHPSTREKIITAYLAASPKGQVEAVAWGYYIRGAGRYAEPILILTPSKDHADGLLEDGIAVFPLYTHPAIDAALSPAPSGGWQTLCFECGNELHAPFCPVCRPIPAAPSQVEGW